MKAVAGGEKSGQWTATPSARVSEPCRLSTVDCERSVLAALAEALCQHGEQHARAGYWEDLEWERVNGA